MMNDFMILELEPSINNRGGSFFASASFKLDNIPMQFDSVEVKIDYGCSLSTIPLRRFNVAEPVCLKLKEEDLLNNREYVFSYGVETGGMKHPVPNTFQDMLDCHAMKFMHDVSGFQLENVIIDVRDIYINYNRRGNALIGMDILQKLDVHIGDSCINGKHLFIACPKNNISSGYLKAIEEHFGFVKSV